MNSENCVCTLVLNGVSIRVIAKAGMTRIVSDFTSDTGRLDPLIDAIRSLQTQEDQEETQSINHFENMLDSLCKSG